MGEPEIKVLVIEDHTIVREGLRLILAAAPGIVVVGDAPDGPAWLALLGRLRAGGGVDVVLTDLVLPGLDGVEVARRAKACAPGVRVLLLSMHDDPEFIRGMLDAGADGYLLKHAASAELAAAIRTVYRGETALSPGIAHRLVAQVRTGRERERAADALTPREREVLALLAAGATSKEAGQRLGLSTKTVQNHRARILEKLGAANTVTAIGIAREAGLLER